MPAKPPAPVIALTLGDPNGLGPELVCHILAGGAKTGARILIIGPESALLHHARNLGIEPFWQSVDDPGAPAALPAGILHYTPSHLSSFQMEPGRATIQGGRAAGAALESACSLLRHGRARALVTCPLNKAMLQQAGFNFAGHTEFLASRAGLSQDQVCMHFSGPKLRVSLVTTHPALREVPQLVTREKILRKLELTRELVLAMGLDKPIAVCGLNPHAGEEGHISDEEARVITPAVNAAAARGWNVIGPLAADTVFHRAALGDFSAILAMYHDQGLAPFKLLHFHEGIQITLGLPYPRTSPDHGTGYDLVGRGTASPQSLQTALNMAVQLTAIDRPPRDFWGITAKKMF